MPVNDNNKPLLLVEGLSDFHFVKHICKESDLSFDWKIESHNGINSVLAQLKAASMNRGDPQIGVVVDADGDIKDRWSNIIGQLRDLGDSDPKMDPNGTIIDRGDGLPRAGIWIMPDNESPGELEDLVIEMIPGDDVVWPLSKAYVDSIPEDNREFQSGKIDRAKLYAWLAVRKKPPHIGAAIGTGDLDICTARCKTFVTWLKRLYDDGDS